jgi:hypothetical protein
MSTIQSRDISVVVQGPIHHQESLTKRVLESVRKHLPDAELILSTWKGSDVSGLDCDILLLNDDPGTVEGVPPSHSNLNRQIVSTRNGLQKATRHYAMKLRTDTLLIGTGFLDAFDRHPERRDDFKAFEHKIVIRTIPNPLRSICSGFYTSDVFQFGLKTDLLLLWDIPLPTYLNLPSEEYIWTTCLRKTVQDIDYHKLPLRKRLLLTEISLFNNFILDTPQNLGLKFPSKLPTHWFYWYTIKEAEERYTFYIINRSNSLSLSLIDYFILQLSFFLYRTRSIQLNLGIRKLLDKIFNKFYSLK